VHRGGQYPAAIAVCANLVASPHVVKSSKLVATTGWSAIESTPQKATSATGRGTLVWDFLSEAIERLLAALLYCAGEPTVDSSPFKTTTSAFGCHFQSKAIDRIMAKLDSLSD